MPGAEHPIELVSPSSPGELEEVRELLRAFVAWHRTRHLEDLDLIDGYFDPAAFERELAGLPGEYVAPTGALLLARCAGTAAGCVALRRIDEASCEMKRMFVSPAFQGRGIGATLTAAVIDAARTAGYSTMFLDTSIRQSEAQRLYRKFGFVQVPPYYRLPQPLAEWLVFMSLDLAKADRPIPSQRTTTQPKANSASRPTTSARASRAERRGCRHRR